MSLGCRNAIRRWAGWSSRPGRRSSSWPATALAASSRAIRPEPRQTHIGSVEWGHFDAAGQWGHDLWLNGDETGANYAVRIPPSTVNEYLGVDRPMILRVKLYRHE